MINEDSIITKYKLAQEQYAEIGVDTEKVIQKVHNLPISIHCWQGDDVAGFEVDKNALTGGIQATGNYPGKARNIEELRRDLSKVFEFVPGKKKLNLHAIYLDSETQVARDEIEPVHFQSWVEWANKMEIGLDFNPTCFSHELSENGFTLSHPNKKIRDFWIRHVKQSRKISHYFGQETGKQSLMNIWIPDGYKDSPINLLGPRALLKESLDECLEESIDSQYHLDVVESKLFGIGSESYVVGSHEFYMGYALQKGIAICLDTGHFHPTEQVGNKISAILLFLENILLHVSRPVRWDSDHVVTLSDDLLAVTQEVMRHDWSNRIHLGMDFFDASINRVVAWTVGARNLRKSLLIAGLEPTKKLIDIENEFDYTQRLMWQEELKSYPWQDIWNYYCLQQNVKISNSWFDEARKYEQEELQKRVTR